MKKEMFPSLTKKIFIGQQLGNSNDVEERIYTKKITEKAVRDCQASLYIPFEEDTFELEGVEVLRNNVSLGQVLSSFLAEYEAIEVYGFHSKYFPELNRIDKVTVRGYRTMLNTYEADVLSTYGIKYTNLSLSDTCVDILMPVYNGEKTIEESIESVLNQTHQQFRLWIIDDGSTDYTSNVCQQYLNDERIHYRKLPHQGISSTLRTGMSFIQGEVVARQDSDDRWFPWHLEMVLTCLEANDALELVGAKVTVENEAVQQRLIYNKHRHLYGEELWYQLAIKNVFNHSTVIFKKSAYLNAGGYHSEYDGIEDWHLWSRMVRKDNAYILNVTTAYYRLDDNYDKYLLFRSRLAKTRGLSLKEVLGEN